MTLKISNNELYNIKSTSCFDGKRYRKSKMVVPFKFKRDPMKHVNSLYNPKASEKPLSDDYFKKKLKRHHKKSRKAPAIELKDDNTVEQDLIALKGLLSRQTMSHSSKAMVAMYDKINILVNKNKIYKKFAEDYVKTLSTKEPINIKNYVDMVEGEQLCPTITNHIVQKHH